MFQSARLKLTAWYLLIIMGICLFFSIAFYNSATQEINRLIHRVEHMQQDPYDRPVTLYRQSPPPINIQSLYDAEHRLLFTLGVINLSILVLAGIAAYFLAGKTLRPIKVMVDEQNRFIADASHELRTPLTALRAELEASQLDKKLNIKEAKTLIASNLEEVDALQVLTDNLLQLTKFQQKVKPEFKQLSLLQIIEDALKKVTPLARPKQIAIQNEIDDSMIMGNARDLCQLFVILLENAVKYSNPKSVITLQSEQKEKSFQITVIDQGIGIAKEDSAKIFDRFYRVDASRTKSDTVGHGLGLAIAKSIIAEHNGTIIVTSVVGKGTTFTVEIPKKTS